MFCPFCIIEKERIILNAKIHNRIQTIMLLALKKVSIFYQFHD